METISNISTNGYRCNICNKNYKNKSGIWKNKVKYHGNFLTNLPPKISTTKLNNKQCEYCNCCFTRKDSLIKHYDRCKIIKLANYKNK
jgi:hypothetical protein